MKKTKFINTIPVVRTLWISSILLVVFLSLSPKIDIPLEFRQSDKIAHFVAYFWLAALAFFAFEKPGGAVLGASCMAPLGLGLEFAQTMVPGRFFSLGDILANFAGVGLGICMAATVKKRWGIQTSSSG